MAMQQTDEIAPIVHKRRWSAAEAQAVLKASREKGMPLSSFALEHGLQRARLWRWSSRLRKKRSGRPVMFHPVRLVDARPDLHGPASIEVVLTDGRRVRLTEGFAAADLARVLAVLEGTVSC